MATSIHGKLTLTLCLTAVCVLPLAGLAVYYTTKDMLLSQMDEILAARGNAITVATEFDDGELELDDSLVAFAGFGEGNVRDFFAMYDADGKRLLRSSSLPPGSLDLVKPEILQAPAEPRPFFGTLKDGRPVRLRVHRFTPVSDGEGAARDILLVTGTETKSLQNTLRVLATVLLIAGVATLLSTLVVLRAALHRGLRPLDDLAGQLRTIEPGHSSSLPVDSTLPGELVPVVEKLNQLLRRVDESLARERRFSSHAAHELRTPLAELRATAELATTWPEEATPERFREMQQITGDLEALVERLSQLARVDARAQTVQKQPVNLEETIRGAVARHAESARERQLTVDTNIAPGSFRTDPALWTTILNNLMGNAISHAPAGSTVKLEASPTRLCVSNPAPNLHADDVPHLFERFWKKESASNKAASAGRHSGLGLSIVAACAEALGGTCKASLSPEGQQLGIEVTFGGHAFQG